MAFVDSPTSVNFDSQELGELKQENIRAETEISDGIRQDTENNKSGSIERYINESYIIELNQPSPSQGGVIGTQSIKQESYISAAKQKVVSSIKEKSQQEIEINDKYEESFKGIAVENVSNNTIKDIEQMDEVKNIYRDRLLYLHLSDSVENIGAATIQSRRVDGINITGEGVEVAVIDSGTNYERASLGGCTFEEMNNSDPGDCRFLPGYDFVDDDYDPMDKEHGTHVAGILGANGSNITGVAPGVKIRSYRVCDSGCRMKDIIAAVQRAMDPNNDGSTADHVDIFR
ncbi:MAG: subtilisin-like serine protease [Candidatus Nanosalina sp. J07AB43]|jgi:Subtilisin-like serine proteases|nr:MAG: subtilisin-like serine protease [Candidatus Nanosalina sp. J07AB43]